MHCLEVLTKSGGKAGSLRVHLKSRAFTLPEVLMASALSAVIFGALVYGYLQSLKRAEWSAYSLAAHSLAMQGLELARAAKWDPQAWPAVDEIPATNYVITTNILDIPISETNFVYATNYVTIEDVSVDPPLKLIRVDTVWMFMGQGPFTNTAVVYRSPDQ